jgi:hypothetical protein
LAELNRQTNFFTRKITYRFDLEIVSGRLPFVFIQAFPSGGR